MNHHHGMQAVERFGIGQRDHRGNVITTSDFDEDGVADELTAGDITAVTLTSLGRTARLTPPLRRTLRSPARMLQEL